MSQDKHQDHKALKALLGKENLPPPPTQEELEQYANGSLPETRRHAIEEYLAHELPEADAIEGLSQLTPQSLQQRKKNIYKKVNNRLGHKKHLKKFIHADWQIYVAVAVLLLLAIMCFVSIKYLLK
ncbi:MAG: hypothetical protein EBX41_02290 [Chitinophagia bacterium]|nr:hypothetical protein [Chitinophagia bacterium]